MKKTDMPGLAIKHFIEREILNLGSEHAGAGGKHHSVVVTSTGDSYSFGSNKEVTACSHHHAYAPLCPETLQFAEKPLAHVLLQGQCGTGSVKSTPKSEGVPFLLTGSP